MVGWLERKWKWILGLTLIVVLSIIVYIILIIFEYNKTYDLVNEDLDIPSEIEDMFLMTADDIREMNKTELNYENEREMLRLATAHYWMMHEVHLDPLLDEEYRGRNELARLDIFEYLKTNNFIVDRLNYDLRVAENTVIEDHDWKSKHHSLGALDFGISSEPFRTDNLYQNDESVDLGNLTIDFVTIDIYPTYFVIHTLIRTNDNTFTTFNEVSNNQLVAEINGTVYGDLNPINSDSLINRTDATYAYGAPIESGLDKYFSEDEALSHAKSNGIYSSILQQYYTIEYPDISYHSNFDTSDALNFDKKLFEDLTIVGSLSYYDIFTHRNEPEYDEATTELVERYRENFPNELTITFHYGNEEADYTLIRGKEIDFYNLGLKGVNDYQN